MHVENSVEYVELERVSSLLSDILRGEIMINVSIGGGV
jgi:hypothetical protein